MIRTRIWNLLVGLATLVNLQDAGGKVREAILTLLKSAKAAAALTPSIVDDLVVALAIAAVESPAWDTLLQWLREAFETSEDLATVPVSFGSLLVEHGAATQDQVA